MALQYMRRHKDWLKYFFVLVIAAFIFLYVPEFQNMSAGTPSEPIGHVGDDVITVGEFQRAYVDQRRFYQRLYQGRLDADALESLGLGERAFEQLVVQRLVSREAARLGIEVSDAEVRQRLTSSPEFQEDGRFVGAARIRALLDQQGVSVAEFERQLRDQMLQEKLEALVTDAVVPTPREIEREFRRRTERVRLGYVAVAAEPFRSEIEIGDEQVRAHFESDPEAYRLPERRVLSYLLVDREALRSRVTVTDADTRTWFDGNLDQFRIPKQVCASHVLIKSPGEARTESEARARAERVLERARSGEDFAALAEEVSEDAGSATLGGDLGCFERGRMMPEFDAAAFELETGEISELVETSLGFHVIRADSVREESVRAFEEVQEAIRSRLVAQRVEERLGSIAQGVATSLRDAASLEEAGTPHGLSVARSGPLAPGDSPEPLGSPLIPARAFEMSAGEPDPDPFAVSRGVVFVELVEVQPPRVPELEEAADAVRADLLEAEALERARARAAELAERAASRGLERAAGDMGLVREETPSLVGRGEPLGELGLGAALEAAAYGSTPGLVSDPVRTSSGYAVIEVLEHEPFDASRLQEQRPEIARTLLQQKRNQAFQAWLNQVRRAIEVDRVPEVYERVVGG
jgi:peptidyl-prolyl cis-trans isomerase D